MNRAFGASRFLRTKSAAVQSQAGIIHQALAIVAKLVAMMVAAINTDHVFDGSKLPFKARIAFMPNRTNLYISFVHCLSSCIDLTPKIYRKWELAGLIQIKLRGYSCFQDFASPLRFLCSLLLISLHTTRPPGNPRDYKKIVSLIINNLQKLRQATLPSPLPPFPLVFRFKSLPISILPPSVSVYIPSL
jgi:hypothetical protein